MPKPFATVQRSPLHHVEDQDMNPRATLAAALLTAAMAGCTQNIPPPPTSPSIPPPAPEMPAKPGDNPLPPNTPSTNPSIPPGNAGDTR